MGLGGLQIATAATFSAAWLEGLRMMLARFEQPDGGFSVMADTLDLRDTVGKCTALLAAAVPAAVIGEALPGPTPHRPPTPHKLSFLSLDLMLATSPPHCTRMPEVGAGPYANMARVS